MMSSFPFLVALLAGAVAQAIKLTLAVRHAGTFTRRTLFSLPGMPSTWSAVCTALCTLIGCREGGASHVFAAAVAFSSIVLYDSLGLRRSAGRQARLLNLIAHEMRRHKTVRAERHLRELFGDTPAQVLGGIGVGLAVALPWVW